tara:strand:+ start:84869 stop:85198 length:330 start_codon:yes stop_codon:yes gene_type:complete
MTDEQKIKLVNLAGAFFPIGTFIGYLILVGHFKKQRASYDTFYYRQFIGNIILGFILNYISRFLGPGAFSVAGLITLAFIFLNCYNIIVDKKTPLPIVGQYYDKYLNFI